MSYTPHFQFIAPAQEKSELWRTIAGLILSITIYAFGMAVFGPVVMSPSADTIDGNAPLLSLFVLFSFSFMILGSVVTVTWLHKRPASTLLGDRTQAIWNFWRAIKAVFYVQIALIAASALSPQGDSNVVGNLPFYSWVLLLPLSLTGLLIQTSAEELLFRGHLQQQLAARFSSPLLWMIVPALLFSFGHYDPANGANAWVIVLWAALFSIAASDLVARTGNLGAAIGLHFANNLLAVLIVSYPGVLGGLSLYQLTTDPSEMEPTSVEMLMEFGTLGLSWLAIRVAVRR